MFHTNISLIVPSGTTSPPPKRFPYLEYNLASCLFKYLMRSVSGYLVVHVSDSPSFPETCVFLDFPTGTSPSYSLSSDTKFYSDVSSCPETSVSFINSSFSNFLFFVWYRVKSSTNSLNQTGINLLLIFPRSNLHLVNYSLTGLPFISSILNPIDPLLNFFRLTKFYVICVLKLNHIRHSLPCYTQNESSE